MADRPGVGALDMDRLSEEWAARRDAERGFSAADDDELALLESGLHPDQLKVQAYRAWRQRQGKDARWERQREEKRAQQYGGYDPYSDPAVIAATQRWQAAQGGTSGVWGSTPPPIGRQEIDNFLRTEEGQTALHERIGSYELGLASRRLRDFEQGIPGAAKSYYEELMSQGLGAIGEQSRAHLGQLASRGGLHTGARQARGDYYKAMEADQRRKAAVTADQLRSQMQSAAHQMGTDIQKMRQNYSGGGLGALRDFREGVRRFDEGQADARRAAEAGAYSDLAGGVLSLGGSLGGAYLGGPAMAPVGAKVAEGIYSGARGRDIR